MKILPLNLVFFLLIISAFNNKTLAQPCGAGTATETLNAANSNITLSSSGIWANGIDGSTPSYGWPRNNNSQFVNPGLIFTGNLWIGGFDDGGNLKMAAKTYGQDENNGYWPGPLNELGGISAEECANWDRLFKVTRNEIETFLTDYNDNDQIDDPIPMSILGWPANGNSSFSTIYGFDLPEMEGGLAPFYDENFDGIYNPMEGDFPQIKCADEAVWWVFNDAGNVNDINSTPTFMEVQILAYVYNTNNSAIYNSSFYDVKFINRGTEPLDSIYVGLWIDPDLGCHIDDYLGCVPEENLVYVYNEDALDGESDGSCSGTNSYLDAPPMYGLKLLKKPLDEFGAGIDMSSFISFDNNNVNQSPSFAHEYYRILTGNRADGAPYVNPDGEPTKFLYSGNPADTSNGWSMCSEDTGSGDRRFVMSVGPMRINPGANNDLTYALVVQPQPELPCPDVNALIAAADLPIPAEIVNSYCNLTVGTSEENLQKNMISIFPNPATDQLNFHLLESETITSIRLYRMDGQLVKKEENLRSSSLIITRNGLAPGTYVYQVQTQSGQSLSGKIILK